jgi:hypothetical protein
MPKKLQQVFQTALRSSELLCVNGRPDFTGGATDSPPLCALEGGIIRLNSLWGYESEPKNQNRQV